MVILLNLKKTVVALFGVCAVAAPAAMTEPVPAFPNAEGAGRLTRGGRGGDVYEVTHLGDSGPGSLREAIEAKGPRTVVFRVSGTIALKSDLKIKNPFITIAGQTAPGDGICLKDYTLYINHNEVIIRYLRFRLGDESGVEKDAIWGRYCKNVIVDHCSASWSVDEALSIYGIDSLTVQWCLISESLYMSHHSKGAHGYGGIWGGRNATFHHNLLAHHSSRLPRFAGGETPACQNLDFRNNVIYNWGFNSSYGGEDGTINMVANYYKPGPATKASVIFRIVNPYDSDGRWYIEGNVVEGYPAVSDNNWAGGVQGGWAVESIIRAETPFPCVPISRQSAGEAYMSVLEDAGANYPRRDAVDARILQEAADGTATYDGRYYEYYQGLTDTAVVRGIIDSQENVGGWPELASLPAPADSDHDGMPDAWENTHGLDPDDATDRNAIHENGYTMLEIYLNSLVPGSSTGINEYLYLPEDYVMLQNYPNPFNAHTVLAFSIPEFGIVELDIADIQGRQVRTLFHGFCRAGNHQIPWDGKDRQGQAAASGIYLAAIRYNGNRRVIKMQLIR